MTTATTFCLNQPLIQNKTFCLQINTFDVIILLGVNDTGVQPKETTILNTSANMIDEITNETRKKIAKEKYFLNSLKEFPEVTGCSTAGAICPQVCAWR